jgi:undecaprenyl diphosphate synthase
MRNSKTRKKTWPQAPSSFFPGDPIKETKHKRKNSLPSELTTTIDFPKHKETKHKRKNSLPSELATIKELPKYKETKHKRTNSIPSKLTTFIELPKHLALIPDGNRRWATENNLSPTEGHRVFFTQTAGRLTIDLFELGLSTFTLWFFSTDNWKRDEIEVNNLMSYSKTFLDKILPVAHILKIRIIHLGRKDRIPEFLAKELSKCEKETADYNAHILNLAIDYGGKDSIIRAINKSLKSINPEEIAAAIILQNFDTSSHHIIDQEVLANAIRSALISTNNHEITEAKISQNIDTFNQPHPTPDMIIRTSEELRLSGFMSWESQYSELFVIKKHAPALTIEDMKPPIKDFFQRRRMYSK